MSSSKHLRMDKDMELEILKLDKSKWVLTPLGNLAKEISKRVDNPSESGCDKFVGLQYFASGDLKIKEYGTTKNLTSSTKAFEKGDILLARRNAYLRRASLVEFDGVCSGDAFVLREDHDKVVPGFLAFVVNSNGLWDYANANAAGTMSKRVKWRDLANYEFLLPPKEQQAELAEMLWSMDEVIEKELAVLGKLETVFLSTSKVIFKDGDENKKALKDVAEIIMGQSPAGDTYNDNGTGTLFLQGNAEFGPLNPSGTKFTTAPKKMAPKNSILFSVRAPVGDLNIADQEYCIGRGLAAIVIQDINLRTFIYNFLKFEKSELERNSTGSTFKSVNKDVLSSLTVVVPVGTELDTAIEKINSITMSLDSSKEKIDSSKSLQKSLINQIF